MATAFPERGELAALVRERDWSGSAVGPVEAWPPGLRTVLRLMLTSRYAMWMGWGPELTFFYNDAYAEQTLGAKHPWALGRPAREVWAEIWPTIGPRIARVLATGEATWDEGLLLFLERSGYPEETYHTFSYSPVPGDAGEISGLFCVVIEETLRVIGERRIALLRDLAAALAEAGTAREVLDAAHRCLSADQRDVTFALTYLFDGDGRATLAGLSGIDRDHPAAPSSIDARDPGAPWPASRATEGPTLVDLDPRSPWPSGRWARPSTTALALPIASVAQAKPAGVFVAGLNPHRPVDDATRSFLTLLVGQLSAGLTRANAYEEERRRAEALAEIDRAKTAFFSNVSHEFRTPLTLMIGPTEDALASPSRSLSGADLEAVHRNELRLLRLVNALLDFSRLEAGRAQARFEPTDLATLTTDLASAFRAAVERAGLAFEVRCEALGQPAYVDRAMWEKIVLNLLSNALKFTFEGAVTVTLSREGDRAALSVRDTGAGVAPEDIPRLFERFHRVEGVRARTHEGTGIGLSLVHELARLHGGEVSVESEVGRGSTFTVRVPLGRSHLPGERVSAASEPARVDLVAAPYVQEALRWAPDAHELSSAAGAGPEAPRVLLADDNADMREYVARVLHDRFTVESVADGAEALEAARARPPDVVLTDVMMPRLDGFGLLRALRSDAATAEVPVVMLSARAGDEARVEGVEAGADDYLVKPFSARELLARVSTQAQLSRLRRAAGAERRRLYELLMHAPAPIAVLTGSEHRFEVANAAFCELTGRESLAGATLLESFPEMRLQPLMALLDDAFERGEALVLEEFEVTLRRRGRSAPAYFNAAVRPMREGDVVTGLMVVVFEVTDQVVARRRVEGLREAAEAASRAKDDFLNTLSHELRTPLNAIIGWTTLLRGGNVPAEQRARALETVERNARVQARLIEDMLDLSRIEQGKLVLSVGPLDMVRVVESALDAVRPAAEAKGIRLQPVLDSHAAIVGDPDRLQQVVWNLLSNAIKFTPKGGRVQVRLRREQSHVELVVADDGQGIAQEFLPHVFDRFRQGDASISRRAGGLGLGLAIVRSLVELHGGVVSAESDGPGKGATFAVRLPMAPLRADRVSPTPPTPGVPAAASFECPPALRGKRVLVVDDEAETRELLRYVISQCDAGVTAVSGGREALAALSDGEVDVVVSDIGMPDMDGLEFIRALRARDGRERTLPALALTAYARVEDRTRALREGFDMHLAKPIDPAELLVVLGTLVADRRRG